MGRAGDRLTRGRVTEPPPVGPWLGVTGMLIAIATYAAIELGLEVVDGLDDGRWWWLLPLWLVGVAQFALLLRGTRRVTVWELTQWPTRVLPGSWRAYLAAGTGLTVTGTAYQSADVASAILAGLAATLVVCALPCRTGRPWWDALLLHAGCLALAFAATPFGRYGF